MIFIKLFLLTCPLVILTFTACKEISPTSNSDDLNNPPQIVEFILSPESPIDLSVDNPHVLIQVVAIDKDGDDLTYYWECSQGRFDSPVGMPDRDRLFIVDAMGIYVVKCTVSDGKSVTVDSVLIEVTDGEIVLPESNLSYTDHISPLFRLKCGSENGCHSYLNTGGPPARDLDLTNYQSTITHLIDGSELIIVPGQGEQSFLYNILLGPVSGRRQMPPDRTPLTINNIIGLKTWIDEGASESHIPSPVKMVEHSSADDVLPIERGIDAVPESDGIYLAWHSLRDNNISQYNVYRKKASETIFQHIKTIDLETASPGRDTTFVDDNAEAGLDLNSYYFYYVTATNDVGQEGSALNTLKYMLIDKPELILPDGETFDPDIDGLPTLYWNFVEIPDQYILRIENSFDQVHYIGIFQSNYESTNQTLDLSKIIDLPEFNEGVYKWRIDTIGPDEHLSGSESNWKVFILL